MSVVKTNHIALNSARADCVGDQASMADRGSGEKKMALGLYL